MIQINYLYGEDVGRFHLKLKELMDHQGITINQMSHLADIKYDVVKRYYYDDVIKYDAYILAKFRYILNCQVSDLLEIVNDSKPSKIKDNFELIGL